MILDEHMDLLRALEMSRLQYLRDSGLIHVPDKERCVVIVIYYFSTYVTVVLSMYQTKRGVLLLLFTTSVLT